MSPEERVFFKAGAEGLSPTDASIRGKGLTIDQESAWEAWEKGNREFENGNGEEAELLIDATDYLDRNPDSGIMELPDIAIWRSVGAKASNYDVKDLETGEIFNFVEGTRLQNVEVFAGKGVKKALLKEVSEGLSKQIGGNPDNWQHVKAIGYIDFYGEERMAEVHWFQEETVGKHKFKIKKWIDE